MPIHDTRDIFFYPTLTLMIDIYKELLSEAKTSDILIRYARKRICDNRK